MTVTFPVRPFANRRGFVPPPGTPDRAGHCRCKHGPLLAEPDEPCIRCGRYTANTISDTWRQRQSARARSSQ